MSTTPVESWAVELADVGPIYPFVGSEVILVLALFVIWIAWHAWQISDEKKREEEVMNKIDSSPSSE